MAPKAMNTKLEYLYRDAANYKWFGAFVFGGPPDEVLLRRLRTALFDREMLVAGQVGLPELAPWMRGETEYDPSVDHALHELQWPPTLTTSGVHEPATTFRAFVRRVEQANSEGWNHLTPEFGEASA